MHSDSYGVPSPDDAVPTNDDVATRNNMSFQKRLQVLLGVLLVMAGFLLVMAGFVFFVNMGSYAVLIGLAVVFLGLVILIRSFWGVIKSSHVAVSGHFLLHPRTGTRYTPHQAIAVQRRLDRIRRATAEDNNTVQISPVLDASPQSQPATPLPWQMEPPPSYENVMKTTTAVN